MKSQWRTIIMSILLGTTFASCGDSSGQQRASSRVKYLDFGGGVRGLHNAIKKNEISACLSGSISGNEETWTKNIKQAILSWIKPLRELTSDPLAETVKVVENSDNSCDTYVIVTPGQWAMTNVYDQPIVNMNSEGQHSTYNTLLHEFGHAFGLADTYQNGASGFCQPGQPQAVMCNISFSELQPDDIVGVQNVFKQLFPNDRPNQGNVPPPTNTDKAEIFAAIDDSTNPNSFKILFAVNSKGSDAASELFYCKGTKDTCVASDSWTSSYLLKTNDGSNPQVIFRTPSEIDGTEDAIYTVRAKISEKFVFQSIRLKKK